MASVSHLSFSKLFKDSTNNTAIQLVRYTMVGGCAFVIDFSSLYFLTSRIHVYYLISAAIAFILGLMTNYLLSIAWVFSDRRIGKMWIEFGLFAAIGVGGLLLNEIIIWFFTEIVYFHYLISKAFSSIVVYFYNFLLRKFMLFS